MKMLRKNIAAKVRKIIRNDGVCLSKDVGLHWTDCNSTVNRLPHRSFLEYVPKISCPKNRILGEKNDVPAL